MLDSLVNGIVSIYEAYEGFIHSILPDQAGDLAVFIINVVIIIAVGLSLSFTAFKK